MMNGGTLGYIDWWESLKQGSLDNTCSCRHCIYDILMSSAI